MIVEWSPRALADLNRFADFLQDRFPSLAPRIGQALVVKAKQLGEHPHLGKPVEGSGAYRELVLHAHRAAYVLQYEIHPGRIVILRVFHGREDRA